MEKISNFVNGFAVSFRAFASKRNANFIFHNINQQGDAQVELILSVFKKSIAVGFLYPDNKKRIPKFEFNIAKKLEKILAKKS